MHYENKSMTIGYILAISGGIFWAVGGACAQLLFQDCHVTSNWIVPVRLMAAGTILVIFSALRGKNVLSIWKNKQDIKELEVVKTDEVYEKIKNILQRGIKQINHPLLKDGLLL